MRDDDSGFPFTAPAPRPQSWRGPWCAPAEEMRAYWEALRGPRPAPRRAEIDPRGMEGALPYAFILDRIAPGVARFRLAGSHLADLMAMEVRGMPVSACIAPGSRAALAGRIERCLRGIEPGELVLSAETGFSHPPLEGRLLLLPLLSDAGEVNRLLGCLVTQGRIGRAPRRFDILADCSVPAAQRAGAADPVPGFADPEAPFAAAPRPAHLRLVACDGVRCG